VAGLFFMKKQCEVEGCDGVHFGKGLCRKHYCRLWRGGDPHTLSREEMTLEERFRAKLAPQDPVTGCIEWIGCRNKKKGYGQISRDGKNIGAHCLAWELKHGPIPEGMCVCHSCDNPPCCNTEHHFLDTKAGNNADMRSKGRQAKGVSTGSAKLTEADVKEIRRRLAAGEVRRVIAADFGIHQTTVGDIKTGRTWSHLVKR
jgi:hypothetical protein